MFKVRKKSRELVARHTQHGMSKFEAKKSGKITSVGSERIARQCVCNYLTWCVLNSINPDYQSNFSTLINYLEERSEWIKQKTLDQERQALNIVYKQKLPFVKSLQESILDRRSYLFSDLKKIIEHQSKKNEITSWLSFFSGIRAHEALTILPISEQKPSKHREWDPNRFKDLPPNRRYSVIGKGGLIREVAVPIWLADILETTRRNPIVVTDREIRYMSHYDIGYGQRWSQSFSSASKKALGYSKGGHGLRHSFAKWRLNSLIDHLDTMYSADEGITVEVQAMLLLSQLLGHFRLDIAFAYLR